ncbi:MAG: amino acid permease [Bacteroidales bacterium]|nr:amino acid permease [Bacteroidales bacterium]
MKNDLNRQLGLFPVTNIVIANMIGAGIFTISGLLMEKLHNPVVMLVLWLVGGLIALMGALSYGKLGSVIPEAGGEYVFLSRLYHPLLGFLSGWVSFIVGFSTAIAASAIGFGEYLGAAIYHSEASGQLFESISLKVFKKISAVLIVVLFTIIHLRGIKTGTLIQNVLTVLKIILIAGLIGAGLLAGKGNISNLVPETTFQFDFAGMKSIGLSLMWIMFAYSGWNAATYIGSEIKMPSRNIPGSLILGTGVVMILYFFLNIFFIYSSGKEMEGIISVGAFSASLAFGPVFEKIISVLISFVLISSLSAFIILGPRVYYAMARDSCFFRFAAEVNPRHNVPAKAILLQAGVSLIILLSGTFDQILTYLGFSLGIFPIIAVLSVYKLKLMNGQKLFRSVYDFFPLLYVLPCTIILVLAYFERPVESSIAIITILLGVIVYKWLKKKNRFSSTM